ncbi:hypothetical protein QBC32DRAFT_224977 [Pseudoneurospora amorphoporcata]|uniref:NmrA-like domain-containing protein n=1 Tax=Pseudoneurospora amorphoporcata TaxID=241081 RepID=A0AAN6NL11_9PEZI|nr:hypothetical protein QBC32DRAFT_224977 [Pseudoneurospora amorphoporcata]
MSSHQSQRTNIISTPDTSSTMNKKTILVTGATGHQGGAVIDALMDLDKSGEKFSILAVTRKADSPAALDLVKKHARVKLVEGNLDNVPALFESAKIIAGEHQLPIWGVFSVQVSMGVGVTFDSEVRQGKALIDGAIANGVQHFVYSSVERGGDERSWENPTPIPHFQTKKIIEDYLNATCGKQPGSRMGWTILRPVAFMENLKPGMPTSLFLTALKNHLGEDRKSLQWISVHDIGVFAAKVFDEPERWNHTAVGLAGDELTIEQLSRAFSKATGYPIPLTYSFAGSLLTWLVKEVGLMIGWFASEGYKADIEARRKDHPDMLTMEQWLLKKSEFSTGADGAQIGA